MWHFRTSYRIIVFALYVATIRNCLFVNDILLPESYTGTSEITVAFRHFKMVSKQPLFFISNYLCVVSLLHIPCVIGIRTMHRDPVQIPLSSSRTWETERIASIRLSRMLMMCSETSSNIMLCWYSKREISFTPHESRDCGTWPEHIWNTPQVHTQEDRLNAPETTTKFCHSIIYCTDLWRRAFKFCPQLWHVQCLKPFLNFLQVYQPYTVWASSPQVPEFSAFLMRGRGGLCLFRAKTLNQNFLDVFGLSSTSCSFTNCANFSRKLAALNNNVALKWALQILHFRCYCSLTALVCERHT